MYKSTIISALTLSLALSPLAGCNSNTGNGALIGGAGGALAGGLIGSASHARAGEGALIGAGVGVISGALIGNAMDKSQEKKERQQREAEEARERSYYTAGPTYEGQTLTARPAVTPNDVVEWTREGVKTEIIIDRIQQSHTIFYLGPNDMAMMQDARVSPDVIQAMKNNR